MRLTARLTVCPPWFPRAPCTVCWGLHVRVSLMRQLEPETDGTINAARRATWKRQRLFDRAPCFLAWPGCQHVLIILLIVRGLVLLISFA